MVRKKKNEQLIFCCKYGVVWEMAGSLRQGKQFRAPEFAAINSTPDRLHLHADYCDRKFKDEQTLVQHQKAAHFKCPGREHTLGEPNCNCFALPEPVSLIHPNAAVTLPTPCPHPPPYPLLQNATASSTPPRACPHTATRSTRPASNSEC